MAGAERRKSELHLPKIRTEAKRAILAEAEPITEEEKNCVEVFGHRLGRAFFHYAVELTTIDYKWDRIKRENKISGRRDVFVQALADKLTTGNREDTVLALTALLTVLDNRTEAVLKSIPYNGPYA